MPSMGIAQYSRAAGLARPTEPTRTAVVAAIEYAGALPATAITTVSKVPRALACSPLPLLLIMVALLSVGHDARRRGTVRRKGGGEGLPPGRLEGWAPAGAGERGTKGVAEDDRTAAAWTAGHSVYASDDSRIP